MPRSLSLIFPSAVLGFTWLTALSGERHLSLRLKPAARGHARGHVELEEESHGGTFVSLDVHGLEPGAEYVSQFHHEHGCRIQPEDERSEIGHFVADAHGHATVAARLDEHLADIGSVDVRRRGDLEIVGCAPVD